MGSRTLRQSLQQQNMQTISETPTEALARVNKELLSLLHAAAGTPAGSMRTPLGAWRQRVGNLLAEATAIAANALQSGGGGGVRTFGQTEMEGLQSVGPATDVHFEGTGLGTIPYDPATGEFTLAANKTYRLTAHFAATNFAGEVGAIGIGWVDGSNTVLHANHQASLLPVTSTTALQGNPTADTFVTTGGSGMVVKCRVVTVAGTCDLVANCTALVQEV